MADLWYWAGGFGDDDFIGGPTTSGYAPESFAYGAPVSVGQAGTATKLAVRCNASSGTPTIKIGLFDADGNVLTSATVANGAADAWREVTISQAVSIATYHVRASSETAFSRWYYNTSGPDGIGDAVAYANFPPATVGTTPNETDTLFAVKVFVTAAAGGGTLTADAGSFAWTGTAAGVSAAYWVAADAGAYTWGGTAAALRANFKVGAAVGAFEWAGTAATLSYSGSPPEAYICSRALLGAG